MKIKIKFPTIKKNYEKRYFKISPNTCWKFLVFLFFATVIFSFIFGYNLFKQTINTGEVSNENTSIKIEREKKEKINKVLEYFFEREKKSSEILKSTSTVIDPAN